MHILVFETLQLGCDWSRTSVCVPVSIVCIINAYGVVAGLGPRTIHAELKLVFRVIILGYSDSALSRRQTELLRYEHMGQNPNSSSTSVLVPPGGGSRVHSSGG